MTSYCERCNRNFGSDDALQQHVQDELRMWYGSGSSLTTWHALCRAIGVNPLPQTCKQCEKAVRRFHVSIIDLIEWGRKRETTENPVQTFGTLEELRAYTKDTG
ncbi:hypothetical protein MCOR27_006870 [Pyricularia oryzae]|uniref:C2H2-type domain-containing protein n=1 Tax=Pyricularia grisea TaxID=148305 RepID=A0ABQ8NGE8_PYRGI|nr:hypothetical protein MCOR01_006610 [Pyricularia oryzae]KAI6296693.1 hypothetical protein MCOR33_006808 [Pyricularia grisea]KAI6263178.1 hypothetical protein MCOR19_000666 [Pyricularia oryzae]KAI6275647.1 hypothetical protein MCOR27_006870 [Pyricularia oryzae]KAI6285030.1 hypothetical protein MCOR26_001730 [Pyricularia oryzae]